MVNDKRNGVIFFKQPICTIKTTQFTICVGIGFRTYCHYNIALFNFHLRDMSYIIIIVMLFFIDFAYFLVRRNFISHHYYNTATYNVIFYLLISSYTVICYHLSILFNRIGCVIVSVLASSAVNRWFDSDRVQSKTMKLVFVASPLSTQH